MLRYVIKSPQILEAYGTGIANFRVVLPNRNIAVSHTSLGIAKPAASYPPNLQHETVMETLAQYGSITRSDVESVLGVGQTRAINVLKSMADAGYLVAVGKGKNTLYRAK